MNLTHSNATPQHVTDIIAVAMAKIKKEIPSLDERHIVVKHPNYAQPEESRDADFYRTRLYAREDVEKEINHSFAGDDCVAIHHSSRDGHGNFITLEAIKTLKNDVICREFIRYSLPMKEDKVLYRIQEVGIGLAGLLLFGNVDYFQ